MVQETRSFLPDIDLSPAARILTAGTIREKQNYVTRSARHARFYALVCVHAGPGRFGSERSRLTEVGPGDLFVLFPGVGHEYGPLAGKTWDESYITFTGRLFDSLCEAGVFTPASPVIPGLSPVWQERMLALVNLAGRRIGTPDAVFVSTLIGFLCEMTSTRRVRHLTVAERQWVDAVYQALDEPQPMAMSLADVARSVGTSYASLVKRFTRIMGEPLGRVRTRLVMDRAAALLRAEGLSVSQIADELGFSDPAYFCRRFRQFTGLSPGEYRRMATGA